MNKINKIFNHSVIDFESFKQTEAKPEPRSRYIIAITPRSGSSYLCDVMSNTRRLGKPHEMINPHFLPKMVKAIQGRTPEEYIKNALRLRKTANGVSGFKASWYQFSDFTQAMENTSYFSKFKYIYLTRRDLSAQAVSLYKATKSSVFHTNIEHSEEELKKLSELDYNFTEINYWYEHIVKQELGWQRYFFENRIYPLYITYEEIEADVLTVMKRIAGYISVNPDNIAMPENSSVFEKVSDARNQEWACRFDLERILMTQENSQSIPKENNQLEKLKSLILKAKYQIRF